MSGDRFSRTDMLNRDNKVTEKWAINNALTHAGGNLAGFLIRWSGLLSCGTFKVCKDRLASTLRGYFWGYFVFPGQQNLTSMRVSADDVDSSAPMSGFGQQRWRTFIGGKISRAPISRYQSPGLPVGWVTAPVETSCLISRPSSITAMA